MSLAEESVFILNLNKISNDIVYYTCITIVNIGFASNILNILICSRKSMQTNTMGYYNILMSIFNILSFVSAYLLFFPVTIGKKDILLDSYISCIIVTYLPRVFIQMSSWLNVMVSLDRTMCISYPKKFKFLSNKIIISWAVVAIFILICCLNIPNVFFRIGNQTTFIANVTSNRTICGASDEIVLLKYTMIVVMRIILPIILTIILNIILIYKLMQSRRRTDMKRTLKKEYHFAFTIIMLNFAFIITEAPFIFGTMFMYFSKNEELNSLVSLKLVATAKLSFVSTFMFSTYMFGSLFFVNLAFNSIFQKEIRKIFFGVEVGPMDQNPSKNGILTNMHIM